MKECIFGLLGLALVGLTNPLLAAKNNADIKDINEGELHSLDTILVKTHDSKYEQALALESEEINAHIVKKYSIIDGLFLVRVPLGMAIDDAVNFYNNLTITDYAEPNFVASIVPTDDEALLKNDIEPASTDPLFGNQWALENAGQSGGLVDADINASPMWSLTTGSADYVTGVMDSGVDYNHNDLSGNLWRNSLEIASNGIDEDGNGYIDDVYGVNTITGSGDPYDDYLHGTHVNGVIGAVGNNGIGISGIMQVAKMVNCKFLNNTGSGNLSDALECIQYFTNLKTRSTDAVNIVAINNSYSMNGFSQAFQDAIIVLRDLDILFVVAAGNNSSSNDTTPRYPSSYPITNIISVAATTVSDTMVPTSNYGKLSVHTSAPGQSIQSTKPNQSYGYLSGTSNATPHVTGLVGILKNYYPNYTWAQIKNLIIAGGKPLSITPTKTISGRRIRAYDSNGTGSLTCSNQVVKARLNPLVSYVNVMINTPINLRALHINCESPNGDVYLYNDGVTAVSLADGGVNGDDVAGDGVYNIDWVPTIAGTYTLDFGGGDTITVRVYDPSTWKSYNYNVDASFSRETITGTSLGAGDETLSTITSLFPIYFAGDSAGFTSLYVSSNGTISFTDPVLAQGSNKSIPFNPPPAANTLIAPFWDDLTFTLAGANIYYQTLGTAPNRKLVIEWRNFRQFASASGTGTFQVVFYEDSSSIRFSYIDTDLGNATYNSGKSATVGVQIPNNLSTQYSFLAANVPSNKSIFLKLVGQ